MAVTPLPDEDQQLGSTVDGFVEAERVIIYSQFSHSAVTARAHCGMRPYGINEKGVTY